MDPATAAILVVALLVVTRTVAWDDILANKPAWNILVWFGTLVPLAGLPPLPAMLALVVAFFLLHYLFASVTAHVTALLPLMLTVGSTVPGMPMEALALLLCLSLGIMGIISPFATGPSPIYAGSGYLPSADYWRLGGIFGLIYLLTFLLVGVPLLLAL